MIVKETLANGRLTARNCDVTFRERNGPLWEFSQKHQVPIDAIALACVLKQDWVGVALSGAATVEQLVSNQIAVDLAQSDELSELIVPPESPDQYWAIRGELAWN